MLPEADQRYTTVTQIEQCMLYEALLVWESQWVRTEPGVASIHSLCKVVSGVSVVKEAFL